jgi:hypothetical protein
MPISSSTSKVFILSACLQMPFSAYLETVASAPVVASQAASATRVQQSLSDQRLTEEDSQRMLAALADGTARLKVTPTALATWKG